MGNQGSNALASAVPSVTITAQFRGYDRFDTAAKLANHLYSGASKPSTIGVATAANWPDALGGGALLGAHPGPNGLSADENAYLTANSAAVEEIVVFGGHSVVPPPVAASIADTVTVTDNWGYAENRVAPGCRRAGPGRHGRPIRSGSVTRVRRSRLSRSGGPSVAPGGARPPRRRPGST